MLGRKIQGVKKMLPGKFISNVRSAFLVLVAVFKVEVKVITIFEQIKVYYFLYRVFLRVSAILNTLNQLDNQKTNHFV